MLIFVNGDPITVKAITIAQLIDELGLDRAAAAVERNLVIVPRSLHDQTVLEAGDRIEIVQFVGGG
ncbi:sulfur carrier protein ThiS [Brevundimonas sp. 2R-24]|uniref:Sulfur carrier protein ThiS n=1 Tax=Peiella sedimenti TaxID=3061083 RepID=A0ABT8SIV3_9CAUL|nr:sulfur carrier protein ThiS [Caulobacteraceae bacterium XZ-24]